MLRVERKLYRKVASSVIDSADLRELLKEFSQDIVLFTSILNDMSKGEDSPNYHLLEKVAKNKKVSENFIVDQAKSALSLIEPERPKENYYELLETHTTASPLEIRKNWLRIILDKHPDRAGDRDVEYVQRLNEAYEVLKDPVKRREYDAKLLPVMPVRLRKPWWKEAISSKVVYSFLAALWVLSSIFFIVKWDFLPTPHDNKGLWIVTDIEDKNKIEVNMKRVSKVSGANRVEVQHSSQIHTPLVPSSQLFHKAAKNSELAANERKKPKSDDNFTSSSEGQHTAASEAERKNDASVDDEAPTIVAKKNSKNKPRKVEGNRVVSDDETEVVKSTSSEDEKVENKVEVKIENEGGDPIQAKKTQTATQNPDQIVEKKGVKEDRIGLLEYTVRKGDSLWKIATAVGVSVGDLKVLNKMETSRLDIGDVLVIPQGAVKSAPNEDKAEYATWSEIEKAPPDVEKETEVSEPPIELYESLRLERSKTERELASPKIAKTAATVDPEPKKQELERKRGEKGNAKTTERAEIKLSLSYPDRSSVNEFIFQYVAAYQRSDVPEFMSFFASDARENGIQVLKLTTNYSRNFASLDIKNYDIRLNKVDLKENSAFVDGDFEIIFRNKKDGMNKLSEGTINLLLYWQGNRWKIRELNYSVENTRQWDG